jgi:asparagine synthase (glutamine-hydrolysing)
MCGIYGIVSQSAANDRVNKHRDQLYHRGPDDAGTWYKSDRTVALAHRRLSIIDLSEGSHQPMVSADARCVIVFNGEIYNYREIRTELQRAGHRFRSEGDTEVVLAAYREWGVACVDHFNGMFAFAIYDAGDSSNREQLFVARDRAGKKPFYYRHAGVEFEFASELKAVTTTEGIDLQALNHYLALGYIPYDLCIAKGVKKLPPAHAGMFEFTTGTFKTWRYWSLPEYTPTEGVSGEQFAEESWELLKDSVRLRLRSDVPIGVFLSGGLDSSLVTAAASEVSEQPIKTFTIAMPGSKLDESKYARLVADHFGTDHHVLELSRPSLNVLDKLAPFLDEPLADSSILPTYLVSKLTVDHVKVALGGDGGDELYGGYRHYQTSLNDIARFNWLPGLLVKCTGKLASKLPAGIRGRNRVASLRGGAGQAIIWGSPYFDTELRKRILHPDILNELSDDLNLPERCLSELIQDDSDPIDSLIRTDFNSILPDDYLVKVDRASMANSLEVRTPFLDYRMVEHAFEKIPSTWKVDRTERRRVQNRMAMKYLPKTFELNRKQGFSIPMDEWMRRTNVHERLESLPEELINRRELDKLVKGLAMGRANGARLFALMVLAVSQENLKLN